jgi:phosphoribosylglycinamide formyltransferase 1
VATLDLGILASGNGSNLQAILDAVAEGSLNARIRLVLSNVAGSPALERAAKAGVPRTVLSHRDYPSREEFDEHLATTLLDAGVTWVALAGFMRVLSPRFLGHFPGRVINIHPALLPAFPGVHAQKQALNYGVKVAGCTVHFVDAGVDTGPIIAQRAVPVLDGDDEDQLGARILEQEHAVFVEVLRWLAADRVRLVAGTATTRSRVVVLPL